MIIMIMMMVVMTEDNSATTTNNNNNNNNNTILTIIHTLIPISEKHNTARCFIQQSGTTISKKMYSYNISRYPNYCFKRYINLREIMQL
jgi:hypothetical protein